MTDGAWKLVEIHGDHERRIDAETYGDRIAKLATWMHEAGIEPGDRVCTLLMNGIEIFEIWGACQRLAAFPVPINYHYTADETRYLLADSGAKLVVASPEYKDVVRDASDGLTVLEGRRLMTGGAHPGYESYEKAIEISVPFDGKTRQAPGVVVYTSGTTGQPKGVMRKGGSAMSGVRFITMFRDRFKMGTGPIHLVTGPLYHSAPSTFSRVSLVLGGDLVILRRFDPEATLRAIERYRVTHVHLVPTMMTRLLALPDATKQRYDLSSLTVVQHAAAPCPPHVKQAMINWWGPIVDEYYGSTEAGIVSYITAKESADRPGSVGKILDSVVVKILDTDGSERGPGEVGDIYVGLAESGRFEYHGDPEKLTRSMRGDLFTNGDMGYLDEDGYLFLVDRRADMIISGGVNIYPAEIESALSAHPGVLDCAVFGIPDDEWGERVHAVVQLDSGAPTTTDEILVHLRSKIAGYKVPKAIELANELPREPSGKIFKRKLRDPHWAGRKTRI